MEEKKNCTDGAGCCSKRGCSVIPFVVGFAIALAFGWLVFPDLLYKEESQPVRFKHTVHMTKAAEIKKKTVTCGTCHTVREDGTFTGIPSLSVCAECHKSINSPMPTNASTAEQKADYASEKKLVEELIPAGKPLDWKVHQAQPDNVYFSHSAHFAKCYTCHLTMKNKFSLGTPEHPDKLCFQCHKTVDELSKLPSVPTDIMTDYTKTTMRMSECEYCHANPGHFNIEGKGRTVANNACFTCHK